MKLCKDCDPRATCCDFCKFFDFNADSQGFYTGDGWCNFHKTAADPAEVCDDFYCEHVKEKKKKTKTKSK
jgi:hypothetical protein